MPLVREPHITSSEVGVWRRKMVVPAQAQAKWWTRATPRDFTTVMVPIAVDTVDLPLSIGQAHRAAAWQVG